MQQPLDHDDNDIIYTQLWVLLTDSFISDLRYISSDLYTLADQPIQSDRHFYTQSAEMFIPMLKIHQLAVHYCNHSRHHCRHMIVL